MSWSWSGALGGATAGSTGSTGTSSSGGGFDWIGMLLAGAGGLAQGKVDRKALEAQFKAQRELLQMSLDARRQEMEQQRGYELEDRAYRQGVMGNYARFAPNTGLLAQTEGGTQSAQEGEATRRAGTTEDARAYGLPEGWRNGQPGGGAVQAMHGHQQMLAQQQAAQGQSGGPGGILSEAGSGPVEGGQAWGARPQGGIGPGPGGTGFNGGDPYGGGGRPGLMSEYGGQGAGFVAGGLFGGPVGAAVGAVVNAFNDPSNPYLGNGNFENDNQAGRNFVGPEAQGQSRQGRNPISDFLDWLREKINNE